MIIGIFAGKIIGTKIGIIIEKDNNKIFDS